MKQKSVTSVSEVVVKSPGRINLLGEHVDYNDGYVLPAATVQAMKMKIRQNGSKSRCTIKSKGFDSVLVADLFSLKLGTGGWHNYALGVLNELQLIARGLKGFDCEMESNVPVGSGVSSSAALECGLAFGLNELFDLGLDKWQLAKIGQRAEHNYVGTKCGIMDQFASIMGKDNRVILLDCLSLDFKYISANFDPYRLLLLNTNVSHNLSSGEYNLRREQCETGLHLLSEKNNVKKSFRHITKKMVQNCEEQLDPIVFNRCLYVVEEIERVLQAVDFLKEKDLDSFGKLMFETHDGLSEKYDVSCPELDFLVKFAKTERRILGARLMGGGFGGCTINLIHKDAVEEFVDKASRAYKTMFGIELSHFQTVPSQGTHLIKRL